jgi:hypothetical protein
MREWYFRRKAKSSGAVDTLRKHYERVRCEVLDRFISLRLRTSEKLSFIYNMPTQ